MKKTYYDFLADKRIGSMRRGNMSRDLNFSYVCYSRAFFRFLPARKYLKILRIISNVLLL
jgi:hypothetical protein